MPSALAFVMESDPEESVTPPVNVFVPPSTSVPGPAFVRPKAPEITPLTVSEPLLRGLELTVIVGLVVSVTAPVPVFKELKPA